mgnify:CR=1 FL=1
MISAGTEMTCLLYTSDAADERSSVDLGGRRIIKKKRRVEMGAVGQRYEKLRKHIESRQPYAKK